MPMLLALAKPKLPELRISLNSGKSSATTSGVPSVEALSTTITSEQTWEQCSRRVSRHSMTYFFAFQTTITTETRATRDCGCGEGWWRGENSMAVSGTRSSLNTDVEVMS